MIYVLVKYVDYEGEQFITAWNERPTTKELSLELEDESDAKLKSLEREFFTDCGYYGYRIYSVDR